VQKISVTYGVTGMKKLKNAKWVHIIKCAHFLPKLKCILHVRNNYDL